MNEEWKEILSDYEQAREALCPTGKSGWGRKGELGRYYLWNAYHKAVMSETKDQLIYARILSMMHSESRFPYTDYERLHKFVRPASEAYQAAIAEGQVPTDKELEMNRYWNELLTYQYECEELPYEDQLKWIDGFEQLEDFSFHDSRPIEFLQTGATARLTLKYGKIQVTFLFEGIEEIRIEEYLDDNWIDDFYCYPCYHDKQQYTFDIGFYRIICKKISVQDIIWDSEA